MYDVFSDICFLVYVISKSNRPPDICPVALGLPASRRRIDYCVITELVSRITRAVRLDCDGVGVLHIS